MKKIPDHRPERATKNGEWEFGTCPAEAGTPSVGWLQVDGEGGVTGLDSCIAFPAAMHHIKGMSESNSFSYDRFREKIREAVASGEDLRQRVGEQVADALHETEWDAAGCQRLAEAVALRQ